MNLKDFIQSYKAHEAHESTSSNDYGPLISKVWKEGADNLMKALRIDIEFLEANHDKTVEIITRDDK